MRKARTVNELYRYKSLYSSEDMFSPPSERLPHVLRFELTTGCGWGRCTYCCGFDGIPYHAKSFGEYKAHVDGVFERVGKKTALAKRLRRLFIGGGNALEVGVAELAKAIDYTDGAFLQHTGDVPARVAVYGRTSSINKIGVGGFGEVLGSGAYLDLIYWGVESGSNRVLRYVRKGCNQDAILEAGSILLNAGIGVSVMIMPGLGGMRFYDEHIEQTAKVLGEIQPRFITFMGVNPPPGSAYARIMACEEKEGKNRPLTDIELAQQMAEMIRQMPVFNTKAGCFEPKIDAVGHNPVTFGSVDIVGDADKDKKMLLTEMSLRINRMKKVKLDTCKRRQIK